MGLKIFLRLINNQLRPKNYTHFTNLNTDGFWVGELSVTNHIVNFSTISGLGLVHNNNHSLRKSPGKYSQ